MATTAAAAIAAAVARARREIGEHFDQAGAFDPQHAVSYEPPDRIHQRQFELLVGRGILRETFDGCYWLDRDALRLEEERRRAALVVLLKIIMVVFAVAATATFLLMR